MGSADSHDSSPACDASMVQVPGNTSDAVLPETVHTVGVIEVKLTARPELAVADNVSEVRASFLLGMGAKVMVWHVDRSHPTK